MQVDKFRSNCYAAAVGVLLSMSSQAAFAQSDNQAWVSDELSTYVRSGPTDGYRIVGTLNAGEQVEVLETSGDYTRVRTALDGQWQGVRSRRARPISAACAWGLVTWRT